MLDIWTQGLTAVSKLVEPIGKIIDDVTTSDEERLILQNEMVKLRNEITVKQMDMLAKQIDLESQLLQSQSSIIAAEANSQSFIARNWRPITMLAFVSVTVGQALGWLHMTDAYATQFMDLVKIGLGGYVVGRSLEKVAPSLVTAIKNR